MVIMAIFTLQITIVMSTISIIFFVGFNIFSSSWPFYQLQHCMTIIYTHLWMHTLTIVLELTDYFISFDDFIRECFYTSTMEFHENKNHEICRKHCSSPLSFIRETFTFWACSECRRSDEWVTTVSLSLSCCSSTAIRVFCWLEAFSCLHYLHCIRHSTTKLMKRITFQNY